jgi:hypothetical protein
MIVAHISVAVIKSFLRLSILIKVLLFFLNRERRKLADGHLSTFA